MQSETETIYSAETIESAETETIDSAETIESAETETETETRV